MSLLGDTLTFPSSFSVSVRALISETHDVMHMGGVGNTMAEVSKWGTGKTSQGPLS